MKHLDRSTSPCKSEGSKNLNEKNGKTYFTLPYLFYENRLHNRHPAFITPLFQSSWITEPLTEPFLAMKHLDRSFSPCKTNGGKNLNEKNGKTYFTWPYLFYESRLHNRHPAFITPPRISKFMNNWTFNRTVFGQETFRQKYFTMQNPWKLAF